MGFLLLGKNGINGSIQRWDCWGDHATSLKQLHYNWKVQPLGFGCNWDFSFRKQVADKVVEPSWSSETAPQCSHPLVFGCLQVSAWERRNADSSS